MRLTALFLFSVLLFGCIISDGDTNQTTNDSTQLNDTVIHVNVTEPNDTNLTNQSESNQTKIYERYYTEEFSFEYPLNMDLQTSPGLFAADHVFNGETGEIMVVMFYNLSKVYGPNQEKAFGENPSETATDFLNDDIEQDPIQMLDSAEEVGDITEFAIVRDGYVSEVPFKIRFSETGKRYNGYALSIYVPERSLHMKVRIVALDPKLAENIKNNFILSFRME